MNAIGKLWTALTTLAASLTALAETVNVANERLRLRLALEEDSEPAALPDRRRNGKAKSGA